MQLVKLTEAQTSQTVLLNAANIVAVTPLNVIKGASAVEGAHAFVAVTGTIGGFGDTDGLVVKETVEQIAELVI